jgi:hypothetical protein
MRNVLQITTEGKTNILDLDGPLGSLGTLQNAVRSPEQIEKDQQGWIECVSLPGCDMYVNEEFLYNGCKPNPYATSLVYQAYGEHGPAILGDVVIVGPVDDEGDSTALNPLAIELLQEGVRLLQNRVRAALAAWN